MRFSYKYLEDGDTRTRRVFAWWPIYVETPAFSGYVWLERLTITERWYIIEGFDSWWSVTEAVLDGEN